MKSKSVAGFTFVFLINTLLSVSAFSGSRPKIHFKGLGMLIYLIEDNAFIADAGISQEKITRIKTVLTNSHKLRLPLLALLQIESVQFMEEISREQLNRTKIMQIAKRMHDISWKIREIQISTHFSLAQLFNRNERESIRKALHKHFKLRFFRHVPPDFRFVAPGPGMAPPPPPPYE